MDAAIRASSAELRGKRIRVVDAVQALDPMGLLRDWPKLLGDGLWELQFHGRDVLPARSTSRQRTGA
jgi:hypothetical protein